MPSVISVAGLTKTYDSGFQALKAVDLEIEQGEIFALLGPNGAGKTTLISIVCGTVNRTAGTVVVGGHDILADYRAARRKIGLVPQEISLDPFETVLATELPLLAVYRVHATSAVKFRPTFVQCTVEIELQHQPCEQ